MKLSFALLFLVMLVLAVLSFSSCTALAGSSLSFDDTGAATFTPPSRPQVIPAK
jgi:hypothetical protein